MTATSGMIATPIATPARPADIARPWNLATGYLTRAAAAAMSMSILLHTVTGLLQLTATPYLAFINAVMIIGCSMCLWHTLHSPGARSWLMGISIGTIMLVQHSLATYGAANHTVGSRSSHHGTITGPTTWSGMAGFLEMIHPLLLYVVVTGLALHMALIAIHLITKRIRASHRPG